MKFLLAILMMAGVLQAGEPPRPLTVCEVLSDLQSYRGRRIEIRGYWDGKSLRDNCEVSLKTKGAFPDGKTITSCDENCKQVLMDTEYTWPNAIYLNDIVPTPSTSGGWVGARTISLEDYDVAFRKFLMLETGTEIATFVGELEIRDNLAIGLDIHSERGIFPYGYGFNGGSSHPAQLIIREIKDVEGQPHKEGIKPFGGTIEQ